MYKTKIFWGMLNISIIGVFGMIAIGSSSQEPVSRSSHTDVVRSSIQNSYCISNGYKTLGYYPPEECKARCIEAGYSAWCTGDVAGFCYCK